jgi:hypothetical protein
MAELTSNARNKLGKAVFGLPSKRAFPMPDANHAAVAKGRATQGVNSGTLSPGSAAKIKAKANKILGARSGADPVTKRPMVHGEHSSEPRIGAGHMMGSPGVDTPSGGGTDMGGMGGAGA